MNRRNMVLICSIVLGLSIAPAANAAWSAQGSIEPDFTADVTLGYQHANPDVDPSTASQMVYFSAVFNGLWAGYNPNVAATGTRFAPGYDAPAAYLGVWKDCNDDGYIGHAESAIQEYSVALLSNSDICEPNTAHNNGLWVYEFLWIYDGAAAKDASNVTNNNLHLSRFINASEVRVWGDDVLPPSSYPEEGGSDAGCFANAPIGVFSSTGALLDWQDCGNSPRIAQIITDIENGELCFESDDAQQEVCEPEGLGLPTNFGFDGECTATNGCAEGDNPQCTDSDLNIFLGVWADARECPRDGYVGLYERCGAGRDPPVSECEDPYEHAAWSVWDCSARTRVEVADPTGVVAEDNESTPDTDESVLAGTWLPSGVNPRVGFLEDQNNNRSVYEGLNETWGHCSDTARAPWTTPEQDVETAEAKLTNDWVFDFTFPTFGRNQREGRVCSVPVALPQDAHKLPPNTPVTDANGCTPRTLSERPESAGVRYQVPGGGFVGLSDGPMYHASTAIYGGDVPTLETRGSSTNTTVDGQGAFFKTFYAWVGGATTLTIGTDNGQYLTSPASLILPGKTGVYGAEWCGGIGYDGAYPEGDTGIRDGWDCDASHWYNTEFGASAMPRNGAGHPTATIPGQNYNLRDTDCYDNSVASNVEGAEGVGLGLTLLDEFEDSEGYPVGPCDRAL